MFGVKILTDDIVGDVQVDGEDIHPREGQWIRIRPSLPLGASRQAEQFQDMLLATSDNPNERDIDVL